MVGEDTHGFGVDLEDNDIGFNHSAAGENMCWESLVFFPCRVQNPIASSWTLTIMASFGVDQSETERNTEEVQLMFTKAAGERGVATAAFWANRVGADNLFTIVCEKESCANWNFVQHCASWKSFVRVGVPVPGLEMQHAILLICFASSFASFGKVLA